MSSRLWIALGQMGAVLAVTAGFSISEELGGNRVVFLLAIFMTGMVILAPRGTAKHLVIALPVALYLTWWTLSFLWSAQTQEYIEETQFTFALIAALTAAATLLPKEAFLRALLVACYVGIAWTIIFLVLFPAQGMQGADGLPGWAGPFTQKNALARFFLFSTITISALETRRPWRIAGITLSLFFILAAQSVTTLIVGAILIAIAWFLKNLASSPPESRGLFILAGGVASSLIAALAVSQLSTLTGLVGRDPTLTSRTDIWNGVLEAASERPWTGHGIGTPWFDPLVEPTATILRGLEFPISEAHNGFLEIVLHLGLIGLGLFMLLLFAYSRSSLALLGHDETLSRYMLLFAAFLVLISLSESTTFSIYLAMLCALHALALRELLRDRTGRSTDVRPEIGGVHNGLWADR